MDKINTIYCDFDGTITKTDAVNSFFEYFASPKWVEYEDLWVAGKISSMENAVAQVGLIREVSQEEFDTWVNSIEINDYFKEFIDYTKLNGIRLVILSDGLDLFIRKILEKNNITDVEYFANHLIYENNRFSVEFPYHNPECDIGAGMCKCSKVKEKEFCYIGDGTSDLCVAKKANILFATKKLHKYCEQHSIKHYFFNSFKDIIDTINNLNER